MLSKLCPDPFSTPDLIMSGFLLPLGDCFGDAFLPRLTLLVRLYSAVLVLSSLDCFLGFFDGLGVPPHSYSRTSSTS
jgi:hypothetical protein